MEFAIIILIVLAVLFAILLFTWIDVRIVLEQNELNGEVNIFLKYLFIKKKIYPLPKKEKKAKEKPKKDLNSYKEKFDNVLNTVKTIKEDVIKVLKYCTNKAVVIKKLDFLFEFGLSEPMDTGILSGICYAGIYNVLGVVHNYMTVSECNINILPDFDNECHNLRLDCILRVKNVHIIVIIVNLVKMYIKLKKKGSN